VKPDAKRMSAIRAATEEISSGVRSDGNALLIQQMLDFYLTFNGKGTSNVEEMLSYGCFCQLLVTRKEGKGQAVDVFDEICMRYQQCTKCVENDNIGFLTQEGEACTWEAGRYEIGFDAETLRMKCNEDSSDGVCGISLCKCDENLAFELAENSEEFQRKMSTINGFEFDEQCIPSVPNFNGGGNGRGDLECCGDYPNRFPFHNKNGLRQCCVDKVYMTSKNSCCKNGELGQPGQC